MHLTHPALTMAGKRKGKIKFRNSTEAQKHRALEADWYELQKKWGVDQDEKKRQRAMVAEPLVYSLTTPIGRTNTHHIKSLDTGHSGPVSSKPAMQYTGTKILGISQMAKSNAVPVFNSEHIVDIARMRR